MKAQHFAKFFLYLFCCDYVFGVAAAILIFKGSENSLQNHTAIQPKSRIHRRQIVCRWEDTLVIKFRDCFERVRESLPDSLDGFPPQRVEEYELSDGTLHGLRDFQWEIRRCVCIANFIRVVVKVDFLRLLLVFVLNLVEDLLSGLLGSTGSQLVKLLGNVVNLVVRILCLKVEVEIVILQRVDAPNCVLERWRVIRIANIQILGLELKAVAQTLSGVLTPVVETLLRAIMNERVKIIFQNEITKIRIEQGVDIIC